MLADRCAFDLVAERLVNASRLRGTLVERNAMDCSDRDLSSDTPPSDAWSTPHTCASPLRRQHLIPDDKMFCLNIRREDPALKELILKELARQPAVQNSVSAAKATRDKVITKKKKSGDKRPKPVVSQNQSGAPSGHAEANTCLIFYTKGPMLRFENRMCKLLVYSSDGEIGPAECEWHDVKPLRGVKYESMNAACEALRKTINGPPSKGKRRWTVNVWTNLTIAPGGTTIEKQKESGEGFKHLLQPPPIKA